jgi:hypothetical protein
MKSKLIVLSVLALLSMWVLSGSVFRLPIPWTESETGRYLFAEDKFMPNNHAESLDSTDANGNSLDLHSLAIFVYSKVAGTTTDSLYVSVSLITRVGADVTYYYTVYPASIAVTNPMIPSTLIFNEVLPPGISGASISHMDGKGAFSWWCTVVGTYQKQLE